MIGPVEIEIPYNPHNNDSRLVIELACAAAREGATVRIKEFHRTDEARRLRVEIVPR